MATPTYYYVDPTIAGNSGTGTIGDPFGDVQYALNTIVRDATNGDQINIKAGTPELTDALTLATYGTPTLDAPITFRGYTAVANDGGFGEIRRTGASGVFASGYNYLNVIDLTFSSTTSGNYILLPVGQYSHVVHNKVNLAATGGGVINSGIAAGGVGTTIANNWVSPAGYIGISVPSITSTKILYNYVYVGGGSGSGISAGYGQATIIGNIVVMNVSATAILTQTQGCLVMNNIVYALNANTSRGIDVGASATWQQSVALNNIICGFSGVGGVGLYSAVDFGLTGYNAFWNCTTPRSLVGDIMYLGGDVALAADPFTNAAGGDFSLTAAAKSALRSAGWPSSYLGASTDPHITIGPVQYGEAETPAGGGGAVRIASARGRTRM